MTKAALKYQLINPLKIKTDASTLDFDTALTLADQKARSLRPSSRLVSWYDAATGKSHPCVESLHPGKPGWLQYAESRKCDMTVVINDAQYVFVYASCY